MKGLKLALYIPRLGCRLIAESARRWKFTRCDRCSLLEKVQACTAYDSTARDVARLFRNLMGPLLNPFTAD